MILNVRKWLEIYQTQFEQHSWISAELYGKEFTRKGGGESLRKIFFEIFQSQLKGFIRIPDFTNFPASTGFLVMEKERTTFLIWPGKFGRECLIKYVY